MIVRIKGEIIVPEEGARPFLPSEWSRFNSAVADDTLTEIGINF